MKQKQKQSIVIILFDFIQIFHHPWNSNQPKQSQNIEYNNCIEPSLHCKNVPHDAGFNADITKNTEIGYIGEE